MAKEVDPSRIKPCIFTLRGVKVILPVNWNMHFQYCSENQGSLEAKF